jgi:hypothetical protein
VNQLQLPQQLEQQYNKCSVFIIKPIKMATGKTIFITYQFENEPYSTSTDYGFSTALHCRYIKRLTTDVLTAKKVGIYFDAETDFPFMANQSMTNGEGFTATKFNVLIQVQDGITDNNVNIKPDSNEWRKYDVTDQILNHTVGDRINPEDLVASTYSVDISNETLGDIYDLDYLNYPTQSQETNENLSFGEESIFFGTVSTDIVARVYSTDIPINLQLGEFNTSTNPTWNGSEPVYITEVAIYDNNGIQVAKGKLNFPIKKDNNVARSIVFGVDF